MKKNYVIGNGFDIHYGLKIDYDTFKTFIEKENSEIIDKIDDLFYRKLNEENKHPSWAKFESMLRVFSDLDCDDIFDEAIQNAEDDMDRAGYWDSPSFNVDYYNDYIDILKDFFDEWIYSIDKKIQNDYIFNFDDLDFFLSFNYTLTLETHFHISDDRILHIHGNIGSEIILGHNDETEPHLMDIQPLENDYRVTSTCEKVNDVLNKASRLYFKDSKNIIVHYKNFFESIINYDDVVIVGLSCGEEDKLYIEEIAKSAKHITFYHYTEDDEGLLNFQKLMKSIAYNNYWVKDW